MLEQPPLFPIPQTSNTSDDYWTPKWIFDALNVEFDLDVACPPGGPPHTPAKAWYTQETDGLSSPWYGTVWMNPPFSKLTPWVHKFVEHGNGICLLPYSKSKWFNHMWSDLSGIVSLPREKAAFVQGDIFLPCFLGAMGNQCLEALQNSKIGRVR